MNILIPHHWLLEHLITDARPEDIQKFLSLSGPSVERIYEKAAAVTTKTGTEHVYDIEVTTNRVDSMSVRGIAREAAVILTQAGIPSKLSTQTNTQKSAIDLLPLPIINDPDALCKRITCVVLQDVNRTATPDWMAERLTLTDQQVHDSVVDITNYITHELGHPVHAFDYDKVMQLGGVIQVTTASKGKPFTTLDNKKYTTVGGEIVFENDQGTIIDLPAIKGLANSSIDATTKNVLLWIENLDADKVRFASMTHAIRTTAAQLSEKHVDPHLAESVLHRGIELYQQLCNAKLASAIYDHFPKKKDQVSITVSQTIFPRYLGVTLPTETIVTILKSLECQVDYREEQQEYTVIPPSFRPDLRIAVDIVEEIARIYGYHNLPSQLMDTAIPLDKPTGVNFAVEQRIKQFLADIGWQEVYTYSMVSDQLIKESGYLPEEALKLQNPLSEDRVYLRRSLGPSLEEVLKNNPLKSTGVFEIAHVYSPRPGQLPVENLDLGMISQKSYREVRGIVEALCAQFYITNLKIEETNITMGVYLQSALIHVTREDGRTRGLGRISILKNGLIEVSLSIEDMLAVMKTHPEYAKTPSTAVIVEDLTFVIQPETPVGLVIETIETISNLVRSVSLADIYNQNYTFTISYLDPSKNLSSEDIEPLRKRIVTTLAQTHNAMLVGSI